MAHKVGSVLGEHYLEVRYEDLVSRPEESLRAICGFLQEPYCSEMLAYPASADQEVPKESQKWHATSITAPDASKLFTWKTRMSLADRIIFEQVMTPWNCWDTRESPQHLGQPFEEPGFQQ